MQKVKSIIYVNYSPYENSGKILDFLLENFEYVFLFSIGFYNLKNKKKYNNLVIYHNKEIQGQHLLFQLPVTPRSIFFLLPLRSIIAIFQIILYGFWLKNKYGKIDIYFTVNAFTAWIGMLLKKIGIVRKTVFWVWDYYPPVHKDKIIMLMRNIYWLFDRLSSSDRVVFVNKLLIDLRKDLGVLPKEGNYPIVSIGTDKFTNLPKKDKKQPIFGFIGVLKKSQGFGIVFDNAREILKEFSNAKYEIIGSGPDEETYKNIAKKSLIPTRFYGYLDGETFNKVLSKCTIGIATYVPDPSNVSHFGDPGKIKRYLSLGIPVIATDVFEFSEEISKSKAGIIIKHNKVVDFIKALREIMADYGNYSKNALKLSSKFYYKKIYPDLFDFH